MSIINFGPPQNYTLDDVRACRQFRVPKLHEIEGHGRVKIDVNKQTLNESGNTVNYSNVEDNHGNTDMPFKACVAGHRSYGPAVRSGWVVRNGVGFYGDVEDFYGVEYETFGKSLEEYYDENDETDDAQVDDAVSKFLQKLYDNHVHAYLSSRHIRIKKLEGGTYDVRATNWIDGRLFSTTKCKTLCYTMKYDIDTVSGRHYDFGVRFPKTYAFIKQNLEEAEAGEMEE